MAKKRVKKQTLAEFRAWLSGVEELQPEDWAPDATQWKTIREKMDHISEPRNTQDTDMLKKLIEAINEQKPPAPHPGNPYAGQPQVPAGFVPPPPTPAGVPAGEVDMTPAAAELGAPPPPALPPAQPVDLTEVAKPNIDSSDGNYSSSFT
jgi:hypothetical protein